MAAEQVEDSKMKNLLIISLLLIASVSKAQEECEIAFISEHYIVNNTIDTLHLSVDNKNQESFPTDAPTVFSISPGEKIKVSSLEWAGEFRNPTTWYKFILKTETTIDLNKAESWIFKQTEETVGEYIIVL